MHGLAHKGAGTSALFSKKRKQHILHPPVIGRQNYVYSPQGHPTAIFGKISVRKAI